MLRNEKRDEKRNEKRNEKRDGKEMRIRCEKEMRKNVNKIL